MEGNKIIIIIFLNINININKNIILKDEEVGSCKPVEGPLVYEDPLTKKKRKSYNKI